MTRGPLTPFDFRIVFWRIHLLKIRRIAGLLLFTAIAFLIQGYHPYAEDAEIYLPGVLKRLNPGLFARNADFFAAHAGHTVYPNLIAGLVRGSHLPLPWVLLLVQIVSIFLMMVATKRLAAALFVDERAHWAAVA